MAIGHHEFELLMNEHEALLKRYVYYKITHREDAEDVLQEVRLAAYRGLHGLRDAARFKQWLIGIAANKCNDYYRVKAARLEIPMERISEPALDIHGQQVASLVEDTLEKLPCKDRQILYLFYFAGYNQRDIAARLNIPLGTVKSRVNTAKRNFLNTFPHPPKGESNMSKTIFPNFKPPISIQKRPDPPFSIEFEEIAGWLIVPRVGEKADFAFYDDPDGRLTGVNRMRCTRRAQIHGIPCVQVDVEEEEGEKKSQHTLFLRLTDTHSAYVAEMRVQDDFLYFGSFMDEEWLARYQVGEDNCGREIHQEVKGIIRWEGEGALRVDREEYSDIIGRYEVTIGTRSYDTVAVAECCDGILTILYVDKGGRTVLFRRYNRFDWKKERYGALWTEKLPDSERLTVNGEIFVHWYDCLGDRVIEGR